MRPEPKEADLRHTEVEAGMPLLFPLPHPPASSQKILPLPFPDNPPPTVTDADRAFERWLDEQGVIDQGEEFPELQDAFSGLEESSEGSMPLQLETRGTTRQVEAKAPVPLELWKKATQFKFSVAAKLRESGSLEDADSLEECHSRVVYQQCDGCSGVRTFRNRCDQFFCPECQPSLSRKRIAGVSWWTTQIHQPKHITLTLRNTHDLTKGHLTELKKFFTRLRHRRFCKGWKGGLYTIEITNNGNGWHLHMHVLVDARWVDARQLALEWASVNGGIGHIVAVKDCRSVDYLKEVTKYAAKGSDIAAWSGQDITEFIAAVRGSRTFGVFGSLYGKRTEFREWIKALREDSRLCKCGCRTAHYYSEMEWQARFLVPDGCLRQTGPPAGPTIRQSELAIAEPTDLRAFRL